MVCMTRIDRERRALFIGPVQPGSVDRASAAANRAAGVRDGSGADAAHSARSQSSSDVDLSAAVSSDVTALLERLRTLPEVRAERVADVVGRLAKGEYLTREAAEHTAGILVGSRTN